MTNVNGSPFRKTRAEPYLSEAVLTVYDRERSARVCYIQKLLDCSNEFPRKSVNPSLKKAIGVPYYFDSRLDENQFYRYYYKENYASITQPFISVTDINQFRQVISDFAKSSVLDRICLTVRIHPETSEKFTVFKADKMIVLTDTPDIIMSEFRLITTRKKWEKCGILLLVDDVDKTFCQAYQGDIWRTLIERKRLFVHRGSLNDVGLGLDNEFDNYNGMGLAEFWYKKLLKRLLEINTRYI